MNGTGFFIWQLTKMPPPQELAQILGYYDIDWVAIKLAEYDRPYNQIGGNDKILREYIDAIRNVGCEVGGWAYVYPEKAGPQGSLAAERIEKFDLPFWIADIEKEWKKTGLNSELDLYVSRADQPLRTEVIFCSYRYPSYHPPLNFTKWCRETDASAPQVYWMGAHNPAEQLQRTWEEYKPLLGESPMYPIGAMWGQVVGNDYWEVSVKDILEFEKAVDDMGFLAHGYWSLDWVLKHNKFEWLEAISGKEEPPPPPPDEDPEIPELPSVMVVAQAGLNCRTVPQVSPTTLKYTFATQQVLSAVNEHTDASGNLWLLVIDEKSTRAGWCAMTWGDKQFLEWVD